MLPLALDAKAPGAYDAIYGCYTPARQRMIRVGDYKLILYPEARVVRLFNLAKDPAERYDLAAEPEQQARVHALFQRLLELQRELDDPLDLAAAYPDL